jgi:acyl-CoA hydrolase
MDFIPSGATLQVGIGSIPNQIATLLAEGDGSDYGCTARCSPAAATKGRSPVG